MSRKRSLEDTFLDEILAKVQDVKFHYYENIEACYSRDDVIYKLEPAIEFLIENNYIKYRLVGSQKYFDITPKGIQLEQSGGFVKAASEKQELFKYAKGSHDYARKAYFVSIAGILVAIILFILSKC